MNTVQMDLLFSHNKDTLSSYLEKETGKAVSLTVTDNSTSMIAVKTKSDLISVRLHRMFLDAGCYFIMDHHVGIAEYFNVDPTLVRLAWIILGLPSGFGWIGYLIAWIIVPEQP